MASPSVSVIVPNYNHAPYLRQRLNSIFNQTFQNFEVIILDDCSTDNSKEIIEEYRNRPQVSHIIYNEMNSGSPFKQWTKGFKLAQGKYIWIAESDDWAELNFLDEMVCCLDRDSSLVFAFCESYWEYTTQTVPGTYLARDTFFRGFTFLKKKQIYFNNIYNASSVLFRKQSLTSIPKDYQNFLGSGDYLFWNYLCETGNVYYISKRLNHFRRHSTATTSKSFSTGINFIENHRIYEYFEKKGFTSRLTKFRIVDSELSQIERNKQDLIQAGSYTKCRLLWEKELKPSGLTSVFLLFWARQINKYSGLPFIVKVWKFFHLPNTDFREKFHQKFDKQ